MVGLLFSVLIVLLEISFFVIRSGVRVIHIGKTRCWVTVGHFSHEFYNYYIRVVLPRISIL